MTFFNSIFLRASNYLISRYRRIYKHFKYLDETQWLSRGELEEIQQEKLIELCRHFGVDGVRDLDDLENLPLTSRGDIRRYRIKNDIRAIPSSTSGTTGSPLKFYQDREEIPIHKALKMRGWRWMGWNFGDRIVRFTKWKKHFLVELTERLRGRLFIYRNETLLSEAARIIEAFKPKVLRTIPSYLVILGEFLGSRYTADVFGETLAPYLPNLKKHFDVYNQYGLKECLFIAHDCEYHNLHVGMEGCIIEEIDGEICVTNLNNYVTPFIRYRTGDLGSVKNKKCRCGRELQVISPIEGRLGDFYLSPSGVLVNAQQFTDLSYYHNCIKEWQILVYPDIEALYILVVPIYRNRNLYEKICVYYTKLFGMKVQIIETTEIEREPSGKKKLVRIMKE